MRKHLRAFRRHFCLALALVMVLTGLPPDVLATDEYDVTANVTPLSAPIEISRPADLFAFLQGQWGNNQDFVLTADIDMIGFGPTQGRGYVGGLPFTGTFDGQGHRISNLRFRPIYHDPEIATGVPNNDNNVGFIRSAGNGAEIRNVIFHFDGHTNTLEGATYWDNVLAPWNTNPSRAGLVIGRVEAGTVTVDNVHLTGNIWMRMQNAVAASRTTARRIGGFVGSVDLGATLNISNISTENLNMRFHGRPYGVGGVIGSSLGTVNMTGMNAINVDIRGNTAGAAANNFAGDVSTPIHASWNAQHAGGVIGRVEGGSTVIQNVHVNVNADGTRTREIRALVSTGGVVGWTAPASSVTVANAINGSFRISGARTTERIGGMGGIVGASHGLGPGGSGLVIRNVENRADIRRENVSNHSSVGGVVGRLSGSASIVGALNSGSVGRFNTALANRVRLGGIVGFIDPLGPGGRDITISNVANTGRVGVFEGTGAAAPRQIPRRASGGIVGEIGLNPNQSVTITDATNFGGVVALREAGGIVGRVHDSGVEIRRAINYGTVVTGERGTHQVGGIVGIQSGINLWIDQSGNAGVVENTDNRTNTSAGRGAGGIVGTSNAAGLRITESFNTGLVLAANFRVGGILGNNVTGNTDIIDVYSIGTVLSSYARGGSGIVGMRQAGNVTIRNAFVGGQFTGFAVGTSFAGTTARRLGEFTGFTISSIYVDNTTRHHAHGTTAVPNIGANRLQTNRGVAAVPTQILTADILPGISSPRPGIQSPWLSGLQGAHPDEQRTYPYFSWQTGVRALDGTGTLETPFFDRIYMPEFFPPADSFFEFAPAMDMRQGSGSRRVEFRGIQHDTPARTAVAFPGIRIYHPYRVLETPAQPASGTAAVIRTRYNLHQSQMTIGPGRVANPIIPPGQVNYTTQTLRLGNYPVSMGLISRNNVVAFTTADPVDDWLTIVAVDAVDGTVIPHAEFEAFNLGDPFVFPGIVIAMTDFVRVNESRVTVEAIGYTDGQLVFGPEQMAQLADGVRNFEIPLNRVPINVRAFIHCDWRETEAGPGAPLTRVADNAILIHSVPWAGPFPPLGDVPQHPGPAANTHAFMMRNVHVGDLLDASARGWARDEVAIRVAQFETDEAGRPILTADGYYTMRIVLENRRVPMPVDVRMFRDTEIEINDDTAWETFNIGPATDRQLWIHVYCPHFGRLGPIPHGNQQVPFNPTNNVFRIPAYSAATQVTLDAEVWVEFIGNPVPRDFLNSDPFMLGDEYNISEDEAEREYVEDIEIIMREVRVTEVQVRQSMYDGDTVGSLIPHATLEVIDGELVGNPAPGVFDVRAAIATILIASASGFESAEYVVSIDSENPTIIWLVREAAEAGTIQGFVRNAETYAGIEGAEVAVINAENGAILSTATTDAGGFYRVANVPIGTYLVMARADGFRSPQASHHNPVRVTADEGGIADVYMIEGDDPFYTMFVNVTGGPANRDGIIVTFPAGNRLEPNNAVWTGTFDHAQEGQANATAIGFRTAEPRNVVAADYDPVWRFAFVTLQLTAIGADQRQVIFWENHGPNNIHYIATVDIGRTVHPPVNPVRPGFTFLGWYTDPVVQNDTTRFNFGSLIYENTDLYARWMEGGPELTHQARFWRNDDSMNLWYVAFVVDGDLLHAPAEPTRTGFTFAYWSVTPLDFIRALTQFEFPYLIRGDIDLHARWEIGHGDTHTVVFRMNDGTYRVWHTALVDHGRTVTPPPNPSRPGFTFEGWDVEEPAPAWAGTGEFNFGTRIQGDLVLNARWREGGPGITHTILFFRNDGTPDLWYAAFVVDGEQLTAPASPGRVGFDFYSWSTSPTVMPVPVFSFPMTPTSDFALHARWVLGTGEGYRVTFHRNDGTPELHEVIFVDGGSTVNPQREVPVRAGWTFLGWYTHPTNQNDQTRWDFGTLIFADLDLYARWMEGGPEITHTARFWRNDGTGNLHFIAFVVDNNQLYAPPTNPTRAGFAFEYWSQTPLDFIRVLTSVNFPINISDDMNFYARWRVDSGDSFTVIFLRNDNTPPPYDVHHVAIVDYGRTVTPPINPDRVAYGFTFIGWNIENTETRWNFGTPITHNLVLTAVWRYDGINNAVPTHTVLFWRNDGGPNLHYAQFVPHGEALIFPDDPLRSAWDFVHWSETRATGTDELPPAFVAPAAIERGYVLYAQWRPEEICYGDYDHFIRFYRNYPGAQEPHEVVGVNDGRTVIPRALNPERPGTDFTFIGWSRNPNASPTDPLYNFGTPVTSSFNLYAVWCSAGGFNETVRVHFYRNDNTGDLHYLSVVIRNTAVARPVDPVREDFIFLHWDIDPIPFARTAQPWNFNTPITADIMPLYAAWRLCDADGTHTVAFMRNWYDTDETIVEVIRVNAGRTVIPPYNPTRPGYTFTGWYLDRNRGTAFHFGTPITENHRLYAGWCDEYGERDTFRVLFFRNDDTDDLAFARFPVAGTPVANPGAPVPGREGFTFLHWDTVRLPFARSITAWDFATPVTRNLNLYAKWHLGIGELPEYTVVFLLNEYPEDYRVFATRMVESGRTVTPPYAPAYINPVHSDGVHIFRGWAERRDGTQVWDFGRVITADTVLYAIWEIWRCGNCVGCNECECEVGTCTCEDCTCTCDCGLPKCTCDPCTCNGNGIGCGCGGADYCTGCACTERQCVCECTCEQLYCYCYTGRLCECNCPCDLDAGACECPPCECPYGTCVCEPPTCTCFDNCECPYGICECPSNGCTCECNCGNGGEVCTCEPTDYCTCECDCTIGTCECENGCQTAIPPVHTVLFWRNHAPYNLFAARFIQDGLTVANPGSPTRTGFSFLDWRETPTGGVAFNFATQITNTLQLFAAWQPVTPPPPRPPGGRDVTPPQVPLGPFTEDHIVYVIGYPDGSFRPGTAISRAEISIILWRLLVGQAKYEPRPNRFHDVNPNSWYAHAVNYLAHRGIVIGYEDGSFRANQPITRAELTAVMSRFWEIDYDGVAAFTDVTSAHWAYIYILNAHIRGWVIGYEDGAFNPDGSTTRAEAVTILNRVIPRRPYPPSIRYKLGDRTIFNDLASTHWAFYEIMEAAVEHEFYIDDDGNEIWTRIFLP